MTNEDSLNRSPSLISIPPVPREPSPRARRLIFAYAGAQKVLRLVGGIFFVVGVALTIPFGWGIPVDFAIALGHHEVMGTVQEADLNLNITINGRHPTEITFTYQIDDQTFTGQGNTRDRRLIEAAQPGATVPLEVARMNPAWARLRGETYSWTGYFGLFILLFPCIGGTILFFVIRSNRREIRAFRFGVPILARVVFKGRDHSVKINGQSPFEIRWEFRVDGEVYSGSLSSMSLLEMEDLMAQDELPVLYDPDKPQVNTVYIA
jgi:hypothetical protein